jgi:hypothetical protein
LPSGQEIWYDTTTVHTTCSTKLAAELALTRKRRAAGKDGKNMQSAGLLAVHQNKLDRYALLSALVERQAQDGLRTAAPSILPVAVSTHGEFCPGAVRLQEWLTSKYRSRLLLEGDRDDGENIESLTADFRREFRSSLLVASFKGLANMLLAAGMPFADKRARGYRIVEGGTPSPSSPQPTPPRPPRAGGFPLDAHRSDRRSEDEVSEAGDSTASSSADSDVDDFTCSDPPRRSARLLLARNRARAAGDRGVDSGASDTDGEEVRGTDSSESSGVGVSMCSAISSGAAAGVSCSNVIPSSGSSTSLGTPVIQASSYTCTIVDGFPFISS